MEQPPQLINLKSASPSRSRANFDPLHDESNVGEQTANIKVLQSASSMEMIKDDVEVDDI